MAAVVKKHPVIEGLEMTSPNMWRLLAMHYRGARAARETEMCEVGDDEPNEVSLLRCVRFITPMV